MAQGPQQRIDAIEKQLSMHLEKFSVLAQRIVELTNAGVDRDAILRGAQEALRLGERERDELRADVRALRTTIDQLLIARQTGPGVLTLLEDAQEAEPTEEEKQAQQDQQELLKYLRKVEADG